MKTMTNSELRDHLEETFNFKAPVSWNRNQLDTMLLQLETEEGERDGGPEVKVSGAETSDSFREVLCWWLGIVTPIAVAILATGAQASYKTQSWFPMVLLGASSLAILFVSLSHLADGIEHITGSKVELSWCFAIAIDVGLVGCEISMALEGVYWWSISYLVVATLTSMALNVHGFLNAKKEG